MKTALGVMLVCAGLSLGVSSNTPGSPVSLEEAAQLHGGCDGVKNAECNNQMVCSNNGYLNGNQQTDSDPGSVPTTYCTKTENQQVVCNDSAATYNSCGD